jgi:hypothetical protein
MDIQQSYDKVVLTNEEIQDALRSYVEKRAGRKVRGHVVVNQTDNERSAVQRAKREPFCPQVEGGAYCYLQPEVNGFNKVA